MNSLLHQPHPLCETIMLIYTHRNEEFVRRQIDDFLRETPIHLEDFKQKYFSIYENYLVAFREKYIPHPDEEKYFSEEGSDFLLFLLAIFLENPQVSQIIEQNDTAAIRQMIINLLAEDEIIYTGKAPDINGYTIENAIDFINRLDMEDTLKWRLIALFHRPAEYLATFAAICEQNRPAFEHAYAQNKEDIDRVADICRQTENQRFEQVVEDFADAPIIYPSMASPFLEWVGNKICIYGVFNGVLTRYQEKAAETKENLTADLKLLSDKSRLEILCSLKESPKCNLEIAQELSLTPATMSHHMNLLLANGFVTIEKINKKATYSLLNNKIEDIIRQLQDILL